MQGWPLHSVTLTCQAKRVHWYNSGQDYYGITGHFMIGYEACSMGGISGLAL